jgi:enamine deaminase RidA (YjgF/YER057c/UK114 family)
LDNTRLNGILEPNGSLSLNNQKITNLATPTLATDGVNKAYSDAKATFKTANIVIGPLVAVNDVPTNVISFTSFITSATKTKTANFTS